MREGVNCTVLMDCCHSGTVLDLPYRFSADDSEMHIDDSFDLAGLLGDPATILCCASMCHFIFSIVLSEEEEWGNSS